VRRFHATIWLAHAPMLNRTDGNGALSRAAVRSRFEATLQTGSSRPTRSVPNDQPPGRASRDNGLVHVPTGFVNQAELTDAVAQAAKTLDSREVRDVRFTLGSDADGEPSIFFGILLTPYASHRSRLADVTGRVTTVLVDQLQPYNHWGLQPYFNFTSDPAHFRNPGWM